MAYKPRNKMSTVHRSKQFIPFAALKGYDEALRAKEKQLEDYVERTGELLSLPGESDIIKPAKKKYKI